MKDLFHKEYSRKAFHVTIAKESVMQCIVPNTGKLTCFLLFLDFKSLSTYEYIVKLRKEDEERAREKEIEEGKKGKNTNSRSAKQNQVAPDTAGDKERYVEDFVLF